MDMCRYNPAYSSIKYIDFPIYPIKNNVSTESYRSIKKILEEYALIYLRNYAPKYPNIRGLVLDEDKIRIEYVSDSGGGSSGSVFKCYIDIYNNILEAYNFTINIFGILNMYNQYYPAYNLEFMNDLDDLREWFQYNSFFCGFSLNDADEAIADAGDSGDTLSCRFYSARYTG
jgi:hypothetical protein